MTIISICSSQEFSAALPNLIKTLDITDDIQLFVTKNLIDVYKKSNKYFLKVLPWINYLWCRTIYIIVPKENFSFRMFLLSLAFPFSKRFVVELEDGSFVSSSIYHLGIWVKILKKKPELRMLFFLRFLFPIGLASVFIICRLLLFRLTFEIRKMLKSR